MVFLIIHDHRQHHGQRIYEDTGGTRRTKAGYGQDHGRSRCIVGRVDAASIHAVYDRTAAVLYGAAMRMTGNEEQACTILRNVFNTIRMPGNGYTTDQGRPLLWLLRQVHAAGSALLKRSGVRAEGTTLPTSPVDQTLYLSLRCYALSTGTMEDHKPGDRVIGRHEVLNHLRRNMPR